MESTSELQRDLEELEAFFKAAKRPTVIRILKENCDRLREQVQQVVFSSSKALKKGKKAQGRGYALLFYWLLSLVERRSKLRFDASVCRSSYSLVLLRQRVPMRRCFCLDF